MRSVSAESRSTPWFCRSGGAINVRVLGGLRLKSLSSDRVARMLKFRGPFDNREWTSYHPDGKRIFAAYAAGVNAFIRTLIQRGALIAGTASYNPAENPDSTEYPDPYERRPDPRDPADTEEPSPRAPSTSEPHPPRGYDELKPVKGDRED